MVSKGSSTHSMVDGAPVCGFQSPFSCPPPPEISALGDALPEG